jgi:hypothetical protein
VVVAVAVVFGMNPVIQALPVQALHLMAVTEGLDRIPIMLAAVVAALVQRVQRAVPRQPIMVAQAVTGLLLPSLALL